MGIEDEKNTKPGELTLLRDGSARWISGVSGGLAGALLTALLLVIPVVNTWLANTKEIQLQQIKNSADQIEYVTKRMQDSDKERDLYKSEMLACQKQLRAKGLP